MGSTVKNTLDFRQLPSYVQRRFVPQEADLTDLKGVQSLFDRLLDRRIESSQDLENFVLDFSELDAAIDQQGTILYIRMTCQTDDEARSRDYQNFIEKIVPAVKAFEDQFNRKYVSALEKYPLDEVRYGLYTRGIRADLELFVEKNVELQTKVDLLSQKYQSLCGAMTVNFEGKERTLQEMSKYLLEPDRDLRERAWRASSRRRLDDAKKLDNLFDEMLSLRNEIGKNAGFANFRDYMFKSLHRFDYAPEDCRQYHRAVERLVVPVWAGILESRMKQMNLTQLRPWDTAVDPLGRAPLKPFEDVDDLVAGCQKIFNRLDKGLGAQFSGIRKEDLLDLASRKGKAPGGYQSTLNESRKPFIFMNAVGVDHDVRTLLHESGHAFHALACANDPLMDYRHGPMEFNEVASMGMELLADGFLGVFYGREDLIRSRINHLEDIVFTLSWVAAIDAFQHWLYENPKHTAVERKNMWVEIHRRFNGGIVDWSGLEEEHAYLWHRQLHIFEVPFYYIEYGIAQLGALQLWLNSKKDLQKTLTQYQKTLESGGSKTLPELFKAAGLEFDFSEGAVEPLMKEIEKELKQLARNETEGP